MTPERWQQIEEVFHAAAARPPAVRAAFLAQACAGDETLRREVECLLAAHEEAASFMNAPALEAAAERLAGEQADLMPGKTIAHYKILSLLGAGGMGEVYLASDTRMGRQVALKLLLSSLTDDEQRVARFQQEARAALKLNHPNIVTIYEVGAAGGVQFIATELIEGETLRARLARADLKLSEALGVATQVAGALAAAHQAGIVHRDIKPENIMLRPDGYAKVLDFGLAKLTEQQPTPGDAEAPGRMKVQTTPGLVMGTASYMSPEQARGRQVDARTDIWSLGVVLYEMFAGRVPFEGETASDVISAVLHGEPPPLARYAPDVPAEMQWVVTRALRKNQEERYQTIKELLGDLRELKQELDVRARIERSTSAEANDEGAAGTAGARQAAARSARAAARSDGSAARPTSSAEYLVTEIKRHKAGAALALAMLLLSATVAGYLFYSARGGAEIHSLAVLPFANTGGDADTEYLSDGITESLINTISKIHGLRVTARTTAFSYKNRSVDPRQVGRELAADAVLTGRVTQRGDSLIIQAELVNVADGSQLWGERYSRKAADVLAVQEQIASEIVDKLRRPSGAERERLTRGYTANAEAYQLYLRGRFYWNKRSPEGLSRAIDYFNQAIALDPAYALAYAGLADSYALLPMYAHVALGDALPKARTAASKALELDPALAEAHAALASVKSNDWDWPGVEEHYQRAIQLNPNYATVHQWYSEYLVSAGRVEQALGEIRKAHELDPLSLAINARLGYTLYVAHRYDESLEQLRKTLELDPDFHLTHLFLLFDCIQAGRYGEAAHESALVSFKNASAEERKNIERAMAE
ncbi:MAG: protein kinase domain-containing protein, partial [Pyrinomonadaceae bacterium]